MNRSNERAARTPPARRARWTTAGLIGLGALAFGLTASLPAQPAQAQFFRWWWWHRDEGPPPIPPGYVGHRHATWRDVEPTPQRPVSVTDIRRRAEGLGLRLLGTPHREGRVYVAFGEDRHGLLHHLTFDAYEGTLIENQATSLKPKAAKRPEPTEVRKVMLPPRPAPKAPADPVAPTTASIAPPPAPAPVSNAASSSSSLNARDLSPIHPQPGSHPPSGPQTSDADRE